MLKNFNFTIKNIDGSLIKEDDKEITAKIIAVNSVLNANVEREEGVEKALRYKLAFAINETGEVNLNAEEIAKLKKLIGIAYSSLVVGQMYEFLDA